MFLPEATFKALTSLAEEVDKGLDAAPSPDGDLHNPLVMANFILRVKEHFTANLPAIREFRAKLQGIREAAMHFNDEQAARAAIELEELLASLGGPRSMRTIGSPLAFGFEFYKRRAHDPQGYQRARENLKARIRSFEGSLNRPVGMAPSDPEKGSAKPASAPVIEMGARRTPKRRGRDWDKAAIDAGRFLRSPEGWGCTFTRLAREMGVTPRHLRRQPSVMLAWRHHLDERKTGREKYRPPRPSGRRVLHQRDED